MEETTIFSTYDDKLQYMYNYSPFLIVKNIARPYSTTNIKNKSQFINISQLKVSLQTSLLKQICEHMSSLLLLIAGKIHAFRQNNNFGN